MASNKYCVIMAGGIGSRFWPKSRQSMPKQFLDILGTGKSFIRHTYERFAKIVPAGNFLVVTNHKYKDLVLQHIPEIGEKAGALRADRPQYGPLHRLCGLYAAQGEPRRRNDRHAVGSPDPQRGRFPHDHRRVPRIRRPARRTADRGHQTHTPRYGLRLHPGFGRPHHQQSQVLHRKARSSSWRRPSCRPASSTGIRVSSSGRCRPSSRPSANTCPSTMPCSAA